MTFIKNLTFPHHIEIDKNYRHGKNGIIIKIAQLTFVELAVWKLMLRFVRSSYILKYKRKCRTVAYGRIIFHFFKSAFAGLKEFLRKTNTTCDTIVQQIVYLVGAFTVNLRLI